MAERKRETEIWLGDVVDIHNRRVNQIDPRRHIEKLQGGMIREDRTAMSNLPTKGFQRKMPTDPKEFIQMFTTVEVE